MDRYGKWLGLGAIALIAVFAALMFMGSQTSGILHTVGASIGQAGSGAGAPEALPAATTQPKSPASVPAQAAGSGIESVMADAGLQLVYTGSLDLVVDDIDAAVAKGRAAILAAGGYIAGTDESRNGDKQTAVVTYRIPAARWEDGLASVRGVAREVVGETTKTAEVGGQLVDLEARLRNLRASELVLVGIAEKTTKVNDLLEVQQQVSDVRSQIEQLDGQRAELQDRVAYGTLVTTYGLKVEQVKEVKQVKAAWDPTTDVNGASTKLTHAAQRVISGAIWFGILWLPFLAIGLVALVIGIWIARRVARRWPAGRPEPRP